MDGEGEGEQEEHEPQVEAGIEHVAGDQEEQLSPPRRHQPPVHEGDTGQEDEVERSV
jgi:hypothetical protein